MSVNLGPSGKGFINWWNGAGLAYKFSIVLGGLIVLVIIAAVIKLIIDKARLRKHVKREKLEKAAKANTYTEDIAIKRLSSLEEGDLFGVRAIQSGYFGGVAQSLPSSPAGSRAPSLYNQPTSPSGPLNGSSPYIPLMHPQAAASPMGSTTSLPLTRSPLGLNPMKGEGQPQHMNGSQSPIPNAMLRDSQRPGTSGSNRPFEQRPPLHGRPGSSQSSRTINLDNVAPNRPQQPQQQNHQNTSSTLRPSASDASNTSPPSTNNGTSHGSRSSSFTSTYSFEEGVEKQPQNPTIVKPFEGLPTLPVLQPLTAEVHNVDSRRPSPSPSATLLQEGPTSPKSRPGMTAELPADLGQSPPRKTNFSTPFRRPSQPENMLPPPSPGFGPLPAAAMNGGPQQFSPSRTQSPGPMNRGQMLPQRIDSPGPGPFPVRGASAMDRSMSPGPRMMSPAPRTMSPGPRNMSPAPRTMSPGPRNQPPLRQGTYPQGPVPNVNRPRGDSMGPRRPAPAPLQFAAPSQNKQPSLPAFLQQDGVNATELEMPRYPNSNEPRSAPPTKTTSGHLLPEPAKKNRLTADILGDFYDSYSYTRNSNEAAAAQQHQQYQQHQHQHHPSYHSNQNFEMHRVPEGGYMPGPAPTRFYPQANGSRMI